MCESSTHLWVSAKQTADGSVDPALEAEGSSGAAAAWMDTNDWVTVGEQTFPISSGDEQHHPTPAAGPGTPSDTGALLQSALPLCARASFLMHENDPPAGEDPRERRRAE